MKKWIIGLVCGVVGVTAAWGQVATLPISESYTATQDWTALTGWSGVGMGTYADGRAQFNANNDSLTVNFDSAPGTLTFDIKGNTATTGTEPMQFDAEESADGSNWSPIVSIDHTQINASTFTTFGPYTLNNASRYVRWTYVNKYGFNVGLNNVYITTGGPAEFSVGVNKTDGFTVEQGTQDAIVATAQNGAEPYGYDWATDMTVGDYDASGDTFTILATAAVGEYYATVTATDDESETADKTVNFSVIAPPDYYVITITPPSNGSVTTTPAEEAAENSTVTINTTPADGYAVGTITVTAADESNVTVTGNTFTMPSQDVTVAVTFVEATGGLIISQYVETEAGSVPKGIEIWNASGSDITFDAGANLLEVLVGANGGVPALSGGIAVDSGTLTAGDVLVIGTDDMTPDVAKTFQFNGDDAIVLQLGGVVQDVIGTVGSDPGAAWSGGGVSTANQNIQLKEGITTGDTDGWTDPSDRFETVSTTPSTDLTGFGVPPGGSEAFSVSFNKTDGFEIEEGAGDAITATAVNGTEPYGYTWDTDMTPGDYSADGNVFTIQSTAALGSYYATVTATDDESETAEKTVTFSVVLPAVRYGITINPSLNGSSTTVPADEAEAGQTVTIVPAPESGYAVGTITVVGADETPIEVTGTTFTMPAQAVTITVTFVEFTGSALIISEVADPSGTGGDRGRFVELYNAGGEAIDLAAGTWYLAKQVNGGTTWDNIALTGTVGAAETYVVAAYADFLTLYPTAPAPDQTSGNANGSGDDGYFLYSGGNNAAGVLQDSYGVINEDGSGMPWEYTDSRAVRNPGVTAGNPTWTASEWTIASAVYADMTPGVHPDGPAVFGVSFNKSSGFQVEEGTSDSVIATAENGTAPYSYVWSSTLGEDYRTGVDGVFTILATAPIGDYSAQVVATDSSDPVQSVTNSLNFSVVAPPTKYAISIVTNAPANGTVTTDPATEAAEGVSVTVNALAGDGFAVESILVNGGAVAVNGNAFVMPAEPVTVTVNFMVYVAPDVLIDFETGTLPSSYVANTATLEDGKVWSTMRVVKGNLENDKKIDTLSARLYPQTGTNAILQQTEAYAEPISEISYWVASYGSDNMANVTLAVEVSSDGTNWEPVSTLTGAEDITATMTEHVVATVPANAVYVRFVATAEATSNKRINLDKIGFNMGPASFGVSLNKSNGFEVQEGQSDAIVATAGNGTAPYTYGWDSTLGATHYTASGDTFTILATAPTGSYSATVTATDSSEPAQEAQRTVTFSVVGLPPGQPAVIISGSLSGTVGVRMELVVSVTNETATVWSVILNNPLGEEDWDWEYGIFPPIFAFTPDQAGNWTLSATAETGSGNYSNTVTLVISEGGGEQPNITEFEVPAGATASATLATTTVGKTYKLQYTTNLLAVPVVWQDADTLAGTGGEITLQDSDPADMARYYRVTEN